MLLAELVGPEGEVVGVDLSPALVEQSDRSPPLEASWCRFNRTTRWYRAAVAQFRPRLRRTLVIHLADPVGALREMSRLLTDNGVLA